MAENCLVEAAPSPKHSLEDAFDTIYCLGEPDNNPEDNYGAEKQHEKPEKGNAKGNYDQPHHANK